MPIYDLSLPISPSMVVWPGDPPVRVEPRLRIAKGDVVNVSGLCLGSHTGTHVDPPYHFDDTGPSMDELSLDILVGKAWVCNLGSRHEIDVTDLQECVPDGTRRLLLKTTNSDLWRRGVEEVVSDFVVITPDAARWIVKRDIRLLGVDYLSVERPGAPGHPVHHALLGAGVIVVEGLDLSLLEAGWYNLYCLPLRVAGGDGAPARAVAVGPLG